MMVTLIWYINDFLSTQNIGTKHKNRKYAYLRVGVSQIWDQDWILPKISHTSVTLIERENDVLTPNDHVIVLGRQPQSLLLRARWLLPHFKITVENHWLHNGRNHLYCYVRYDGGQQMPFLELRYSGFPIGHFSFFRAQIVSSRTHMGQIDPKCKYNSEMMPYSLAKKLRSIGLLVAKLEPK